MYSSLSLHSLFVFTFINLKLATLLLPGVSHYLEIDVESISMFAWPDNSIALFLLHYTCVRLNFTSTCYVSRCSAASLGGLTCNTSAFLVHPVHVRDCLQFAVLLYATIYTTLYLCVFHECERFRLSAANICTVYRSVEWVIITTRGIIDSLWTPVFIIQAGAEGAGKAVFLAIANFFRQQPKWKKINKYKKFVVFY